MSGGSVACSRCTAVERGVRQSSAEQGDAGLVLFLGAAADQAARIAADEQAIAEVRPQELRQALDRGAVGRRDEGNREVVARRAALVGELLGSLRDRRIEPCAEADGARDQAMAWRGSGTDTDFIVRDHLRFAARRRRSIRGGGDRTASFRDSGVASDESGSP